ncbi:MAG TPA: penicillin acylase family protein [Polyangiaceae bacterium]|nr:penicillin acylase family protein [Polyangiaceae bacterium]
MNFTQMAFGALLGKRLTPFEGRLEVGCRRGVQVRRDRFGVAYVDARDEADAWFGLGFCHGQDRAGQLEITWRLGRGLLSQALGPAGLPIDRAMRLLGVHRAARAQLETFDADVRDQLAAYVAGVNAALECRALPKSHEHTLLRLSPSRWEPADVVTFGLLMCCFLPSNWDVELARLIILTRDGEEAVKALDATWPEHLPLTEPPGALSGPPSELFVARDLEALRAFVGDSGGSNAWAVQGRKSATGRALLCNDPHLPAALPNLGYLTRVKCPAFTVAGISLAGIPAFITGHNGHAAWGSTSAQVDNADVFLEELSDDGKQVRQGDGWVACEERVEEIPVKGAAAVPLRVIRTARGTVVARTADTESSIFEPIPTLARANALSFAATWLECRPTRSLLSFHQVKSFDQFREVCAKSAGCAYSLIYADATTVGWVLACEVPRRSSGYGSLPLAGWLPHVGWDGIVASNDLPWSRNPSEGYVCCANNKPVADHNSAVFLGHDFLDGYRQKRIAQQLGERNDWTVQGMLELQVDVLSLAFLEMREALLALTPRDADALHALAILKAWDGRVAGDSVGASVYELFGGILNRKVCEAKAPNSFEYATGKGVMKLIPGTCLNARRASFVARLVREQPPGYFSEWAPVLEAALGDAIRLLRKEFGAQSSAWAWGKIRPLTLHHRFGDKKPLDQLFNRGPIEGWGDGTTVSQAGFEFWHPLRHSTVTPHLRSVFDIGNWGESRFVLLGGQSGNPLSPHYADLVPLYQRAEGIPVHWDDAEVQRHSVAMLSLVPSMNARPPQVQTL